MPEDWTRAREADRGVGSLLFQTLDKIHSRATDARLTSQGGPFPVLIMLSDPENTALTPALQKANDELAAIVAKAPLGYELTVRGTGHFNFTDLAIGFNPVAQRLGVLGSIDRTRGLRIASTYLVAFFDQTLKGQSSSMLQDAAKEYAEVQFSAH